MASARSSGSRTSHDTQNTAQRNAQRAQNVNFEELFMCFICMGTVDNAVMCPTCSKLACSSCLRQWIENTRQQCPHCRTPLQSHQLVNARFVADIMQTIKNQEQVAKQKNIEYCSVHTKTQLDYFCNTCRKPICSDCAMMGDTHKHHSFEKLKKIYE